MKHSYRRDPAGTGRVSHGALAFLTKAAKGIKGGIDPRALEEALPLIGWSIQDVIVTTPLDGEKASAQLKDAFQENNFGRYDRFGGSDNEEKSIYVQSGESQAKALFRDIKAAVTETSSKKPVARLGEVILQNLRVDLESETAFWRASSRHSEPLRWVVSFSKAWMGIPGWIVKNAQGGEVVFTPKMNYRGKLEELRETGSARFWSFAYKSGLKELAKNFLDTMGADVVQNILKPVDPRTLINTGTCPACFRNTKLVKGTMMRHGWEVAGRRQRGALGLTHHTGPCFGVGYEPFEVSPLGTKDYLKMMVVPTIKRAKEELAFFKTRPRIKVDSERGQWIGRKFVYEIEEIDSTDRRYERALRSKEEMIEQALAALEEERDVLSARVAAWKPKPLYAPPTARDPFGHSRHRSHR